MPMDNSLYKFSIIIPVYKTEKELSRCVDSVLMQAYKNFEIILVDDGSPDRCGDICNEYVEKYKYIKCIHQSNQGPAAARNSGLEVANGQYVLFMDSDDMWNDNEALMRLNLIIDENPDVDVICFGYTLYDAGMNIIKKCIPTIDKHYGKKYDIVKQLVYDYQYYNAAYLKALKRTFLIGNGIYFQHGVLSEDIGWSGRVLVYANDIKVCSSAFYSYILRTSGSSTSSIGKKNITDIINQIEEGVSLVEKDGESEEMKHLYYEYWAYQYAMILGDIPRIRRDSQYEEILGKYKKYTFLLKYHHNKKVLAVFLMYSVFGFDITMKFLYRYLNHKWR